MSRRQLEFPNVSAPMDQARSDYQAARDSRYRRRRTGVNPQGSGADWHYRSEADWLKILEQARDFDRNDMVVGQTVDRAVTNTIQDGMSVDPQTGDDKVNDELEARWKDYSESADQCDVAGEMTFGDFEWMAFRAMLVDGDMVILPTVDGQLQAIEAHRVRTPPRSTPGASVVHGVQLDQYRKRLRYYITKDDAGLNKRFKAGDFGDPIDVRDQQGYRQLFHLYNPKRVSQTRGVSAFAPIFDPVGMFEDVNFAAMVKQQVSSCFTVFRELPLAAEAPGANPQLGTQTQNARTDGSTETVEGVAPGVQIRGRPGEKLTGFAPNIPGENFFPHMRLILTIIGINLGMPLVLVLMDGSETNFSGYRGAVDQARLGFRRNQRSLIRKFHTPCYLWKVRNWIAADAALKRAAEKLKADIFKHEWKAPRWPYIEPTKDATGDTIRLNGNLASPRGVHAERGGNWFKAIDETVEDWGYAVVAAMKQAARINKQAEKLGINDPVAWRELLRWQSSISVNVDAREQPQGDARKAKE